MSESNEASRPPEEDEKRDRALDAARLCFGQYGYRRTTMGDIAQAAGMSRPALYLLFENKEDVLRSASARVQGVSNQAADAALAGDGPFAERLRKAVFARHVEPVVELYAMPHGAELIDVHYSIASDVSKQAEEDSFEIFRKAIAAAEAEGAISLAHAGLDAGEATELLHMGLRGLKTIPLDADVYRERVGRYLKLWLAGVAAQD